MTEVGESYNQIYWKNSVRGEEIPGSTRIPIFEIRSHFFSLNLEPDGEGSTIVDLGSGSGRSTDILRRSFPKSNIVALDLNIEGLQKTQSTKSKVAASVENLPFSNNSVDVFTLCGVMTNLVGKNPDESYELRLKAAGEIARCLRNGGLCVISDFTRPHLLSGYPVNYRRHALITKEVGTIAVFNPSKKVSFIGLTDEEVAQLSNSPDLQRFAHHYKPEELISIFKKKDLQPFSYSIEIGKTPSGTLIDTIIMSIKKPN